MFDLQDLAKAAMKESEQDQIQDPPSVQSEKMPFKRPYEPQTESERAPKKSKNEDANAIEKELPENIVSWNQEQYKIFQDCVRDTNCSQFNENLEKLSLTEQRELMRGLQLFPFKKHVEKSDEKSNSFFEKEEGVIQQIINIFKEGRQQECTFLELIIDTYPLLQKIPSLRERIQQASTEFPFSMLLNLETINSISYLECKDNSINFIFNYDNDSKKQVKFFDLLSKLTQTPDGEPHFSLEIPVLFSEKQHPIDDLTKLSPTSSFQKPNIEKTVRDNLLKAKDLTSSIRSYTTVALNFVTSLSNFVNKYKKVMKNEKYEEIQEKLKDLKTSVIDVFNKWNSELMRKMVLQSPRPIMPANNRTVSGGQRPLPQGSQIYISPRAQYLPSFSKEDWDKLDNIMKKEMQKKLEVMQLQTGKPQSQLAGYASQQGYFKPNNPPNNRATTDKESQKSIEGQQGKKLP